MMATVPGTHVDNHVPRNDNDRTRVNVAFDHRHHYRHIDHRKLSSGGSGGDSCLVGIWEFDLEDFVDTMREIAAEEGGLPEDFDITPSDGSYLIEMRSDGTLEGVREDWGFAFELDEGEIAVTMNGTEEGTWSADGDTIDVTIASSETEVTAALTSGGVTTVLPTSPIELPEAIAADSQYECDEDTLTVTTDDNTVVLRRNS